METRLQLPWPAPTVRTDRLVIRPLEIGDRPGCLQLLGSPQVRRFLGGPVEASVAEARLTAVSMSEPGHFAVEAASRFLGTVTVSRRSPSRPGHLSPGGSELEVSYTFLPDAWGQGYAVEAVASVLEWVSTVAPDESVVLCTQRANTASVGLAERLGFEKVDQFEEFGAQQWFGSRGP